MKMTKTYQKTRDKQKESDELPGYPEYSHDEDIYSKAKLEDDVDPENTKMKKKSTIHESAEPDDLDIPGSELDDEQEELGNEDEENNYYSLPDNDEPDDERY